MVCEMCFQEFHLLDKFVIFYLGQYKGVSFCALIMSDM